MMYYKRDTVKTMYPDKGNHDNVWKLSQMKNERTGNVQPIKNNFRDGIIDIFKFKGCPVKRWQDSFCHASDGRMIAN